MYIAADATDKDITWDSEPLYRFLLLEQTDGTQPMDLVGTWERILTEIEGDVTETPAGLVTKICKRAGSQVGSFVINNRAGRYTTIML